MSSTSIPGPNNITRVELPNGIIVLVYENFAAQSVVIAGSLEAGSIYEDHDKSGTASMTASALMRGTKNRDFDSIHSSLEDIGADLDVGAGTHTTGFSGKAHGPVEVGLEVSRIDLYGRGVVRDGDVQLTFLCVCFTACDIGSHISGILLEDR